jgi:glycosyltransferase involved in cell wall biosynthesis
MPDKSIANSRDLARVIAVTASVPFSTDEEAFVQDELAEMYRQGLSLSIFPMRRRSVEPNEPARKSGLADVVVGERLVSRAIVAGALRTVGRQPRRSLSAIASALRASHGRRNFLVNASSGLKALWLAGQVDRLNARHLHAYWLSHTSTTAMIAAKIAGITWSATGYRWDIDADNALDLKLSTASFIRCADELGERQLRQAALRIPDACPIYLVRTGVPIPPTAAWSSTRVGTTVICCAAAFVEKKGHAVLLSAFKEVRRRRPAMELHLFGDGPLRDAITAQVRDLGLVGVVILHRVVPLEDLRSFLRTRRPIYVQPSIQASDGQQEGIPVTLIEAMANGAPVVSTRSGSIASLILDNCGLLVPPKDAAALAEALVATAEDPVAAHHRCLDAVARLKGDFDLFDTAARMQQLVRAAASPPSAGRGTDAA